MLGIATVMVTIFLVAKGYLSNSVLLDDVSSVWRNGKNEILIIDIDPFSAQGTVEIQANGKKLVMPVTAEAKDDQKDILKLTLSPMRNPPALLGDQQSLTYAGIV